MRSDPECYVYLIRCGDSSFYKIGVSERPNERLRDLQAANPHPLSLVVTCSFASKIPAMQAEADVHIQLDEHRMSGEWFDLTPKMAQQLKYDMIVASQ